MKKFLLITIVAMLIVNLASAKIFRVGYPGIALAGVDYANFQEAHDAAAAGDTLQIYSSSMPVSGNVSKRLVIIGLGYNLDTNPNLQVINKEDPSICSISLIPGSDGTVLTGLVGNFTIQDPSLTYTTINNITFQRCKGIFFTYNALGLISNVKLIGCIVNQLNNADDPNYALTNLQLFNCIISSISLSGTNVTASVINCVADFSTQFGPGFNNANVLLRNSIFYRSYSEFNPNTVYENNFFIEDQPAVLPPGSNNRWGQTTETLFNRLGGISDEPSSSSNILFDEDYFTLKAGSPAINGGFNAANGATDCGIYGGELAFRYKLSGIPAVPAIYKLTAPSLNAGSNPYNVTISVRSNN